MPRIRQSLVLLLLVLGGLLAGAPSAFADAGDCPSGGSKTLMLATGQNTTGGYGCGYLDDWDEHSISPWATQVWTSYPALGYKYDYVCDHQTGGVGIVRVTTQLQTGVVDGKTVPVTPASVTYTATNTEDGTRHWSVGVIWNTGDPKDGTLPAPGAPPAPGTTGADVSYTQNCGSDPAGQIPSYVLYQSSLALNGFPFGTSVASGSPFAVGFTSSVVSQTTLPNGQTVALQVLAKRLNADGTTSDVWMGVGKTTTGDTTRGALTALGCIGDAGSKLGCAATQEGLGGASGVYGGNGTAVSADGKSVYVVGTDDNAVVSFTRDPSTGALTPQGCVADAGSKLGCAATQDGLDGASGIAVSPDGTSVYVASINDSAIVRLGRDPSTGALTPQGCIADAGSKIGCASTQEGLSHATGVAVSADGKSVYVSSSNDDAVVRFDRAPSTGALTPQGCIADTGSKLCAATQEGLNGASGIAVSPDGTSVYVASINDSAIVRLGRDPSTGALTPQGCIADAGSKLACASTQEGLSKATGVAISPDGKSVYVAGSNDDAVVSFTRDPATGTLTGQGCVANAGSKLSCAATGEGLDGPTTVAVSSDGASVYATGVNDDAVVRFGRDSSTGALTPAGCIADTQHAGGCASTQEGLNGADGVAISPDGKSVYAAASVDDAVAAFARATPAPGQPTSTGGGGTLFWKPVTTSTAATTPNAATLTPGSDPSTTLASTPTVKFALGTYIGRVVYPGLNVAVPGRGYTPAASPTFNVTLVAPPATVGFRAADLISGKLRAASFALADPIAAAAQGVPPPPPPPPLVDERPSGRGNMKTVNAQFTVPTASPAASSALPKLGCPKGYALLNVEIATTGDGSASDSVSIGQATSSAVKLQIPNAARGHRAQAQLLCRSAAARHVYRAGGFAYGTVKADTIRTALANKTVFGGLGADRITVTGKGSTAVGGLGDDTIVLRAAKSNASGGPGNDHLRSVSTGRTLLTGGTGRDVLVGSRAPTLINAKDGRGGDVVRCLSKRDRVVSDRGDVLIGPCTKVTLR